MKILVLKLIDLNWICFLDVSPGSQDLICLFQWFSPQSCCFQCHPPGQTAAGVVSALVVFGCLLTEGFETRTKNNSKNLESWGFVFNFACCNKLFPGKNWPIDVCLEWPCLFGSVRLESKIRPWRGFRSPPAPRLWSMPGPPCPTCPSGPRNTPVFWPRGKCHPFAWNQPRHPLAVEWLDCRCREWWSVFEPIHEHDSCTYYNIQMHTIVYGISLNMKCILRQLLSNSF